MLAASSSLSPGRGCFKGHVTLLDSDFNDLHPSFPYPSEFQFSFIFAGPTIGISPRPLPFTLGFFSPRKPRFPALARCLRPYKLSAQGSFFVFFLLYSVLFYLDSFPPFLFSLPKPFSWPCLFDVKRLFFPDVSLKRTNAICYCSQLLPLRPIFLGFVLFLDFVDYIRPSYRDGYRFFFGFT